jgi:hypothetical protein
LLKRRTTHPAMQFVFDGVTKTVRNNHWKGYSLEISSNGGSTYMRCYTTNSRWW